MASRQATRLENAEAAAREAVDNLSDVNKERRIHDQQRETGLEHDQPLHQYHGQQENPGILGSIMRSMGDTYDHVKDAVTCSRTHDVSAKPRDEHENFASEAKDGYDHEKQEQGGGGGGGGRNVSMVEIGEYTNYATTEKARENKEAVSGRMGEMRDSAAIAARRAMDYITGKPTVLDPKALQAGDINDEKYAETEPKAREKMAELKLKKEGVHDEAKQRAQAHWDTAADRGYAAKKNIYGAMGTVKDAIKDKLTYPTDIVHEARAAREYGGPKRARGDKLVDEVEEGPSGPAAMPSAKASG